MISEDENKQLHRLSAKWRLFLFFRHSFVWVLAGLVVLWLSSFFLVGSIAEQKIGELCGGAAYVQSGRLTLSGGIRLKGVMIASDKALLADDPILQVDVLDIKMNPWRVLRGDFVVRSMHLEDFLLAADYDDESDRWNFQQLAFQRSSQSQSRIPFVTVRNGALRVQQISPDQTKSITAVGLNGHIAAQTGERAYTFTLEADGRYGFGDSTLKGTLNLGDDSQSGQLAMQGHIAMPEARVFDNSWNLENIQLECDFDKQQFRVSRCDFSMGQGQFHFSGGLDKTKQGHRGFNLDMSVQQFSLSQQHQANSIVYSPAVLKRMGPGLGGFFERYHPTGAGDIDLSVRGSFGDLRAADISGAVVCRDVSILPDQFPYPVDQMTGQIELAGNDLRLKELKGQHGDVELAIDGAILDMGANSQIDIRVTSPNMQLNDDLYKALDESIKKVWFSFMPQGRTQLDYRYQRSADGRRDTTLTLELKDTGLVYDQFPYPLENLTGTVIIEPDHVKFDNLVAHYDDQRKVTLNGQVLELRSKQPNFRIHVDAEQIPVDDELIQAMPVGPRGFFDKLEIDAAANIDVDIFRNETGKRLLDFIAKIQIDGQRLVYDDFALPMTDVHLAADITHELVQLHRFKGTTDGGSVDMSGLIVPKGEDVTRPGLCLDLNLTQFDLNETFWTVVGADATEMLGDLRLQGRINANGHLTLNLSGPTFGANDLVIQFLENPILLKDQQFAKAQGQLHWVDDQILFEQYDLKDVFLESIPRELLSEAARSVYDSLVPRGMLAITVNDGFIEIGDEGFRKMDVIGNVNLEQVACGDDEDLHQFYGQADGQLSIDFKTGDCRALAKYDVDHFLWKEYLVKDLRGQFVYDPNTSHFESRDFTAQLYDGQVTGDLEVDLSDADKTNYQLNVELTGADVKQLLGAEHDQALKNIIGGLASGTLNLEGDFKQLAESRGTVTAQVKEMKLGNQSLMGRVLTAMKFRTPNEFMFREIQVEATVHGPVLTIGSARMVGDPLIFRGTGTLNLETKAIRMDLVAFDRFVGKEDTIIDMLARGIGKALWKIELRGDIDNPKIDAVFLSVLKSPLNMFKKKKD